jgi:hypothetical protein
MASMGDDKAMKSSYELAMERLRKSDEAAGVERRPVTEAQKAAIAEVRNFYEAKLAEVEVLYQGRMRTTMDPAERAAREEEYRRDRERLTSERDAKIEKARRGDASESHGSQTRKSS